MSSATPSPRAPEDPKSLIGTARRYLQDAVEITQSLQDLYERIDGVQSSAGEVRREEIHVVVAVKCTVNRGIITGVDQASARTWGFFPTLSEAHAAVEGNARDIHEGTHDLVVIETLRWGIPAESTGQQWFLYREGRYRKHPKSTHVTTTNWSFG